MLTKIKPDANGNSRYVTHYTNLLTREEARQCRGLDAGYSQALANARALGGRKYHCKSFGGGIVFQTTMPRQFEQEIIKISGPALVVARAGILVQFVPCTNARPDRWRVRIRDFPTKTYPVDICPFDLSGSEAVCWFAQRALAEHGLEWIISGAAYIERVGYVFTTN